MFNVAKYHNTILRQYGIRVADKVHARRLVVRPASTIFTAADELTKERRAEMKKAIEAAHDKRTAKEVMAELYANRPAAEPAKKASTAKPDPAAEPAKKASTAK